MGPGDVRGEGEGEGGGLRQARLYLDRGLAMAGGMLVQVRGAGGV